MKVRWKIILSVILILLVSCSGVSDSNSDDMGEFNSLVISEVMTGKEGNNQYDYIELYNGGDNPVDLNGLNLVFVLKEDGEEIVIASWSKMTLVPPHGHYLIGLADQDYGVTVDYEMEQSLLRLLSLAHIEKR